MGSMGHHKSELIHQFLAASKGGRVSKRFDNIHIGLRRTQKIFEVCAM